MRINPVYKSVNRPLTILGVERRLFFFAAILGSATFNLFGSFLGGLLILGVLMIFGAWATRTDPKILYILMNSTKYKAQYCPVKFEPIKVRRQSID